MGALLTESSTPGLPDVHTHPGASHTILPLYFCESCMHQDGDLPLELACAGRWGRVRGYAARKMLSVWQQVRMPKMRSRLRWISWPGIKKELALHPRCSLNCAQVLPYI